MVLEGNKVVLKSIRREDTDDIIRWRNQPFVRDKFIYQELFTKESHEIWLKTMVDTGKVQQYIIYVKSLEAKPYAIGSAYLRDIDKRNLKAEFGIFIGEREYLGQGFGSDAAEVVVNYAFKELNLHKIMLRVFASNRRAIESYKKVGFVEEGYFKDEIRCGDGFRDVIFMAMIME